MPTPLPAGPTGPTGQTRPAGPSRPTGSPDVSVVVPVYNAMPYLRRCLRSLLGQTLGRARLEIVAVDDGSTDGGGRLLDRAARRFPGTVRVLHQANSGGPAGPCNRALDLAAGRYVFFVGADDHLGPEALARLVAAGDAYGADVVLGRVVGVNGRYVHQAVFARDEAEIGLADSALPWALTNVKLFRRDLLERHRIRYPEDLPLGSDLPFTLEACHRARRISVLAGYDCYYAVRRLDAGNISGRDDPAERLNFLDRLVAFTTGLIGPGKERDAVLARLFGHEAATLLRDDLLRRDRATQRRVHATVRDLAARHLNAEIEARLEVETRLRVAVARDGSLDDLLAVLRTDARHGAPPTVAVAGRWYAAYPGQHPSHTTSPGGAYEVTGRLADWAARLAATDAGWARDRAGARVIALALRVPRHPAVDGPVRLRADDLAVEAARGATGLIAEVPIGRLVAEGAPTGQRWSLRAETAVAGRLGSAPLRAPGVRLPRPAVARIGARFFAVALTREDSGHLTVAMTPLTPRRLLARLRSRRQ